MVASRERQHGNRVPYIKKYQTRILPIAGIYGGNASGKTNLFRALGFVKKLVTKGTQPSNLIPVQTFRLDKKYTNKPSRFSIELLINDSIYEFSFSLNSKAILEERLIHVTSSSEKTLYYRQGDNIAFDKSLESDQFLNFAFKGTRENQLFLTNSVSQKIDIFKPVYDWFKSSLRLIAPDSRFEPFERLIDKDHPHYSVMNETLRQFDTGISYIGSEEIPFENLPFHESLKNDLQEEVKEGMSARVTIEPYNQRFIVTRKNGELLAKKLVTYHHGLDGKDVKFDIILESDGSKRVIDLLPAFLDITAEDSTRVYVIDELDRSLHTLLTKRLIESYLSSCTTESRMQMLFTTHDLLLMDQEILRRDEMWVVERDNSGCSKMYSLSDYKEIRYDKDIRKSYLQGRFGGIPRITLSDNMMERPSTKRSKDID